MLRSRYTGCIYIAINRRNGRAYIGKTLMQLSRRRTSHHVAAKSGKGSVFHAALRKYGERAFHWSALFESDCEDTLFDAERSLIADFRACGVSLYNVSPGGEGASVPCSEDRRRKLSVTMKGRIKSAATRLKLRDALKGRPKTAAHIKKMSESKLGKRLRPWSAERRAKMEAAWARWRAEERTVSDETRAKMSEAAKRRFGRSGEREKSVVAGRKGAEKRWRG